MLQMTKLSRRLKEPKVHIEHHKETPTSSTPGPLPIIAKFIDWKFSEKVKSNFIKAATDKHPNQTSKCTHRR